MISVFMAGASLGVPVTVRSSPHAARSVGPRVFRTMTDRARRAAPTADAHAVFDCGADPGYALSAIRHGNRGIRLDPAVAAYPRVAAIARSRGIALDDDPSPALDLAGMVGPANHADLVAMCRNWLADGGKSCPEAPDPSCQGGGARVSESHGTVFHGFSTTGENGL
ncbi:MAG: hypothetical protein EA406_11635 [Rhodospirillales bacterium]|nr:MAG: hypothetical protein EA406_11635 [Rhodospirillales bacterium]